MAIIKAIESPGSMTDAQAKIVDIKLHKVKIPDYYVADSVIVETLSERSSYAVTEAPTLPIEVESD